MSHKNAHTRFPLDKGYEQVIETSRKNIDTRFPMDKGLERETTHKLQNSRMSKPCTCPHCGYQTSHTLEQSCDQQTCPECGTQMVRGLFKSTNGMKR